MDKYYSSSSTPTPALTPISTPNRKNLTQTVDSKNISAILNNIVMELDGGDNQNTTNNKRKPGTKSKIWDHFTKDMTYTDLDNIQAFCNYCGEDYACISNF